MVMMVVVPAVVPASIITSLLVRNGPLDAHISAVINEAIGAIIDLNQSLICPCAPHLVPLSILCGTLCSAVPIGR